MKSITHFALACALIAWWPLPGHSAPLDLPERPGTFWLQLDALPVPDVASASQVEVVRFASLADLTEHALRARPESRAAWLGIQVEAASLDVATAANWPILTGQLYISHYRELSSIGVAAPTLNRYGPTLSLDYVLYDFGARAASIDAQRYQLVSSLLTNNRILQDTIAEVEAAYYAWLSARAQVQAARQQETALRASLSAVEVRLQGGLAARADQLRARAALAEAQLARQTAERDQIKAEAMLKQAAGIGQMQTLKLDWEAVPPVAEEASLLLADLLAEAERQRPDLRALQATAASARAEAERARAARWPSLSLVGDTGRNLVSER